MSISSTINTSPDHFRSSSKLHRWPKILNLHLFLRLSPKILNFDSSRNQNPCNPSVIIISTGNTFNIVTYFFVIRGLFFTIFIIHRSSRVLTFLFIRVFNSFDTGLHSLNLLIMYCIVLLFLLIIPAILFRLFPFL